MATPLRVLILEDRPSDAELMLLELRRADFEPVWQRVETEQDYLDHLAPALDVILADYSLPQFDALSALHLLQAGGLDVPFIVVTGAVSEMVAVECMKQGAADYLVKDRLSRLGQAVAHALEQKRLRDEKRQAEATLKAAHEYVQRLIDSSLDMIISVDKDRRIVGFNRAAQETFGYSREEIIGRHVDVLYADPVEGLNVHRTVLNESRFTEEITNRRKNGEPFPTFLSASLLRDDKGEIVGVMGVSRDISERKEAERKIQTLVEAEREYNAGLRRLNEAVRKIAAELEPARLMQMIVDEGVELTGVDRCSLLEPSADGKFLVARALSRPLEGLGISEISEFRFPVERSVSGRAFIPDETVTSENYLAESYTDPALAERFHIGSIVAVPLNIRGAVRAVLTFVWEDEAQQFAPVQLDLIRNFVSHVEVALTNVALFQQAGEVEALREVSRLKTEFVSLVSHELKNPLTYLVGYAELLANRDYPPDKAREMARTILREGTRLNEIVEDLLDLSRIESGRFSLKREPVNVFHLAREACDHFATTTDQHQLINGAPANLRPVMVDRSRTRQVLDNLLSNAIRYSPEGGKVSISADIRSGEIRISVSDEGIGIAPNELDKIFGRFYRTQQAERVTLKGSGLGLAVCKAIAEAHGGRIWANSAGVGQGSTFTVALPY